jgi:Ca2+-binding EF-hand superfamily protein
MDTDKSGKISKAEFMAFMEAEFNRLDKDKSGELDPKELTLFQLGTKPGFLTVGK